MLKLNCIRELRKVIEHIDSIKCLFRKKIFRLSIFLLPFFGYPLNMYATIVKYVLTFVMWSRQLTVCRSTGSYRLRHHQTAIFIFQWLIFLTLFEKNAQINT